MKPEETLRSDGAINEERYGEFEMVVIPTTS